LKQCSQVINRLKAQILKEKSGLFTVYNLLFQSKCILI